MTVRWSRSMRCLQTRLEWRWCSGSDLSQQERKLIRFQSLILFRLPSLFSTSNVKMSEACKSSICFWSILFLNLQSHCSSNNTKAFFRHPWLMFECSRFVCVTVEDDTASLDHQQRQDLSQLDLSLSIRKNLGFNPEITFENFALFILMHPSHSCCCWLKQANQSQVTGPMT